MSVEQPHPRTLVSPRGAALALIIVGLLFSSVYPMRRYFAVRSGIESLRAEERRLDARIDELAQQRDRLNADDETERLAREELGMVRPGEVPFVIVTPAPAPAPAVVDPSGFEPAVPDPRPPMLERWWEAMKRATGTLR